MADYQALKASFVGRNALLDELISSLKHQATAERLQHWMILGTRGMGKSHIIAMIYHMVNQDETLNGKWVPLLMNEEEQGVFSIHTLFLRIMAVLSDELKESDAGRSHEISETLDSLRDGKSEEEILETTVSYLKDFTVESGKRLLVLLENADDLFTRCLPKPNHIKKLRNILINENFLLFLATSPTSFERISRSNAPLYGFFRIRRLDLFDYDQSMELLKKWAELEDESGGSGNRIAQFCEDDYRLRVLHHLTGGNPRVLLFLYMAISGQGGIETAADTFSRLLEKDLSVYYLSRMRDLANQVQPIVIALAESDNNLTQTEIARKTFLPAKSIGTAVVRLENDGIVRPVTDKKGKNTLYTLTDHLFRLWYQWRTNVRDRKVVGAVVEFLAIWYKKRELETWAKEGGLSGIYCQEAIDFRKTQRFRTYWEAFRGDAVAVVHQHLNKREYSTLFETLESWKEWGLDTDKFMRTAIEDIEKHGGVDQAEAYFHEKLKHNKEDFDAHLALGRIFFQKKDFAKAEKSLISAVEINSQDVAAWNNLGVTRYLQDNHAGAEKAFEKAVELDPEDATAWSKLGAIRYLQDNYAGAEKAYEKAIALDPKNAAVWKNLCAARLRQDDYAGAEKALEKAVELDQEDAAVWRYLGATRLLKDNCAGAEKAFEKAVALDPKNAAAWENLALSRYRNYRFVQAAESLIESIKLNKEEISAYEWLCCCYMTTNLPEETLDRLGHSFSLDNVTDTFKTYIRFLRAIIHLHNGDKTPFLKDLEAGAMLLKDLDEEQRREILGQLMDFLVNILIRDNIEEIRAYIDGLKQVYPEQADVFNPFRYVLDYYTESFSKGKKKGTSAMRAQRVLDHIPGEMKGPVEEMVREAEKNILWWERRPF
jgi:Flp pilus assembly protein TadD/DNA-binding MarR family transcriptional regulator